MMWNWTYEDPQSAPLAQGFFHVTEWPRQARVHDEEGEGHLLQDEGQPSCGDDG